MGIFCATLFECIGFIACVMYTYLWCLGPTSALERDILTLCTASVVAAPTPGQLLLCS